MIGEINNFSLLLERNTNFMSWKTIHRILGLAAVDEEFAREILERPLEAIDKRGFQLTEQERSVLAQIHAETLAAFSRQLLEYLEYRP